MRTMGRMGRMGLMWAATLLVILLGAAMPAGCDESRGDFRGRQVTAAELDRLVESEVRAQQERDRLEAEALLRTANKRRADFELAVARLDANSALELASLRAEYEASAAEMSEAVAAIRRRSESAIATIRDDAASARESIERQNEQRAGAYGMFEKVLPMTPAAPWSELILGGLAAVLGGERVAKGIRSNLAAKAALKDRDANYEEGYARGKAEAEAKAEAANKAWEEAMLTMAAGRLPVPPPVPAASRVGPAT